MRAKVFKGAPGSGDEKLQISAKIYRASTELNPSVNDLTIEVRDDEVIFSATVPAGTMTRKGKTWVLRDALGSVDGIKLLKVKKKSGGGATIGLETIALPMSNIHTGEHMVHVSMTSGNMEIVHRRMWVEMNGGKALGTSR